MTVEDVQKNEEKFLDGFPNTYTYTKNMAEKFLIQNKGDLRLCIWRPAIIVCSAE